jgi:hypothetical protein
LPDGVRGRCFSASARKLANWRAPAPLIEGWLENVLHSGAFGHTSHRHHSMVASAKDGVIRGDRGCNRAYPAQARGPPPDGTDRRRQAVGDSRNPAGPTEAGSVAAADDLHDERREPGCTFCRYGHAPAGPTRGKPGPPFPCNRSRDRLPRSAQEITNAAAGVHRGARERGCVAVGDADAADKAPPRQGCRLSRSASRSALGMIS